MTAPARVHPEALGREILPPGSPELAALLERRPARMLAEVAVYVALILGAFTLFARVPALWSFALAFVVIGNCQYALSILTHEGNHAMLFRRRSRNDLFARWLLCAPLGVDFEGERDNHLEHHRLFATESDPDRYLYQLADKNSKLRLLFFLTGFSSLPHILAKARRTRARAALAREQVGFFSRGRRPTLLWQMAIALAISHFVAPWAYVALWLAPLYVMAFVPHKIRMLCEHAQLILPDTEADGRRLLTFRPSFVEKQLIAPIGLSYHAEHHMFPGIPYYGLPRVAPRVEGHAGVERRTSYLAFLVDCLRRLPLHEGG